MTLMVALLRGVNVGGHTKVAMADLRAAAEAAGFDRPRTYIQSGNLVFAAKGSAAPAAVAAKLAAAIAERTGHQLDIVVRSETQLRAAAAANPFLARGEDPADLHVIFDGAATTSELPDLAKYAPDEAVVVGRDIHLFLPNGLGRSKLADLARRKGVAGTARNWRTITKLIDMFDE